MLAGSPERFGKYVIGLKHFAMQNVRPNMFLGETCFRGMTGLDKGIVL